MKPYSVQKNFVSELDQFLQAFDKTHPRLSTSQCKEKEKYQRVYKLRDQVTDEKPTDSTLWEKF